MTRVIAGKAGGRRLAVPPGTGTRPTSDRAREGLFSTWQSLLGGPLDGERVLDLYAGSGAEVRAGRAEQIIRTPAPAEPYDVVFLDPPYAVSDDDLREILLTLRTEGWLGTEALVTVERSTRGGEFRWPHGFEAIRARRYGEGTFWYGRAASTCEDAR